MSAFEITAGEGGPVIARIEAPNRRAALSEARARLVAREMTTREIIDVVSAGKSITPVGGTAAADGTDAGSGEA